MSPGLLLEQQSTPSLSQSLESIPQEFLVPSSGLHASALADVKQYSDPLALFISDVQERRLQQTRRKRKRGKTDELDVEKDALRLKELYLAGFTTEGVWGQARRISEAGATELLRSLRRKQARTLVTQSATSLRTPKIASVPKNELDHNLNDGFETGSDSGHDSDLTDEAAEGGLPETTGEGEEEHQGSIYGAEDDAEDDIEDDIEDESGMELEDDEAADNKRSASTYVQDKFGLNDGFFDIDQFNKDTEFLEQGDQQANGDDSDEDDIDYFADPMSQTVPKLSLKARDSRTQRPMKGSNTAMQDSEDEDEDENDAPGFGNADLNAPWSDDDGDDGDNAAIEGGGMALDGSDADIDNANANDIRYKDFFDPPPNPIKKAKRLRALPKTQPEEDQRRPSEQDIQRTIDSVRRDLFDDDFSEADESSDESNDNDVNAIKNLSSHERRKLALSKQIRELEAAAISKRSWQMSGEATAHARPENALLEEDLDFERAGKPVPVITTAVSASIEDMIKQRILDRNFDEVVRRRPDSQPGSSLGRTQPRRGLVELSDQKDSQGLGEIYEHEYLARTDPNAKDPRSEALKVQHAEIEKLWADLSGQLDALTSWRYKPKPADIEVKIITNAPRITMEDARPSGVEGVRDEQGQLAPQEVFRVGQGNVQAEDGVTITKGGGVVARDELTREQKLRRRRREKERIKKQEKSTAPSIATEKPTDAPRKSKRDDQSDVLKQLEAGGVKVIGKGGKLQDLQGQRVREKAAGSAGTFKL